jgi:hypothetical protein
MDLGLIEWRRLALLLTALAGRRFAGLAPNQISTGDPTSDFCLRSATLSTANRISERIIHLSD